MDAFERLRREAKRLQETHDLEYELYGVLLEFTEQMAQALIAQDLKRSELAQRLGTSRAWVTKLLDGQENMTLKTMVRVANALDMDLNVMLKQRPTKARSSTRRAPGKTTAPRARKRSAAARSR